MNIPGFSTNGLKMMLKGIIGALQEDDATPAGQDKPYGVRTFADWRILADDIEAELDRRGETYAKVPW